MKRGLRVEPGWVVVLCATYCLAPPSLLGPFLAAVLFHELGHAAALWCLGVPLRQLRLGLAGAALVTGPMDYRRELLCALAGPAASLLLLTLRHRFPTLAALSLLLAAFNLLPVYPLDGGRALGAALLLRLEQHQVQTVLDVVGACCCGALLAGALWCSAALGCGIFPVLLVAALLLRVGLCRWQEDS